MSFLVESESTMGGLINRIVDNRFDPVPYGILADFLEEQGDPLAELLRLSIQMFRHQGSLPGNEIAMRFWDVWRDVLPKLESQNIQTIRGDTGIRYRRGTGSRQDDIDVDVNMHNLTWRQPGQEEYEPVKAQDLPLPLQRAVILVLAVQNYSIAEANGHRLEGDSIHPSSLQPHHWDFSLITWTNAMEHAFYQLRWEALEGSYRPMPGNNNQWHTDYELLAQRAWPVLQSIDRMLPNRPKGFIFVHVLEQYGRGILRYMRDINLRNHDQPLYSRMRRVVRQVTGL